MVIDTLQLDIIVNNKGTTARINNTTNALKNLHKVISDINGAGGVDGAVNGGGGGGSSSRGGSSRSSGSRSASRLAKSLNFGSMVAKLYFVRNITKQLGQNLAKVVQYGIDYQETLNLWQTAMRGNISQARVFTSEMTKAYGISSATLMNYQATFKNMLSALGNISEGTAYGLSEALTQMALDFSSLYNVSVESAMTKFQAVLSGQVRPIRTAGYDITEQTLFQLYQSIGGTKTVRQLNQTEKQLLRILAVYKQMERSGATGDLAKTITSSANQLRIMKEQIQEFATWVGVAFNTLLEKSNILVTINAYLYAGVALAKEFAVYMGYVEKDYGISWSDDIKDAEDEYEKFKGKLLGFDKFQVLASAGTDNADVEQVLLDSIKAYQGLLDNAENPAFQKSLDILKAIGLELDENGNIVGGFNDLMETITQTAKAIGGLALIVGAVMAKSSPLGLLLAIGSALEYAYWTNEEFKTSVNDLFTKISTKAKDFIPLFANFFVEFLPIAEEIGVLFLELADLFLPIVKEGLGNLLPAITPLSKIVKDIAFYVKVWLQFLSPIFYAFAGILDLLTPILEFLRLIGGAISAIFTHMIRGFTMGGLLLGVFEALAKVLQTIAELARSLFQKDWGSLGDNLKNIWKDWHFDSSIKLGNKLSENVYLPPSFSANDGIAPKASLLYTSKVSPELVTQTSSGNSTSTNMQQLEDAVAKGMFRAMVGTRTEEGEQVINVGVDGQNLFTIFRGVARRNGYDLVKVN
jgi:hypothetical protein